jgi:beta-N-acetylhexosaminidase
MTIQNLSPEEQQWVDASLAELTLEQKVGQVFCPYMIDERLSPEEQIEEYAVRFRDETKAFTPGGYYLNRYYIPITPAILNNIKKISPVPPLICADMEAGAGGGLGGVVAPDLVTFPPAMGIGATGSEQYAYQAGRCTGWQARMIGVHFVFAPSLDVNINHDNPIINIRSFGEDPELVSRLGSAFIRGLQDGGVAASAKHFPGHGDTSEDSHLLLSTITADRERLDKVELYPYHRAINNADVYAIMTAHLAVPALEPNAKLPATLSSIILKDLLRDEMGFTGLIVTDAMLMGGVTTQYEAGEAAVLAFKAGADWILMSPDMHSAYSAVLKAVQSNDISEERLNESVVRVLSLKAKLGLHEEESIDLDGLSEVHDLNHYPTKVSYAMCDSAVTVVKNDDNILPLRGVESMTALLLNDAEEKFSDSGESFFEELSMRMNSDISCASLDPGMDQEQIESVSRIVEQSDVLLVGLVIQVLPEKDSVEIPEEYANIINAALAANKQVIMISFGNPYILRRFPDVTAYICAYSYFQPMVNSVVDILFGERIPYGKLPVSIPGICPAGTGLHY